MPKQTKKHFFNNRCYYDHIKDQDLISDMNKCWKYKRSRSVAPGFKTDLEVYLNRTVDNLQLRNNRNNNVNKSNNNNKNLIKTTRNYRKK